MPISQIIAADFSNLQFANARATESIPITGDGFNAYLARIMNTENQFSVERWAIPLSEETYNYGIVQPPSQIAQPPVQAYEPDRTEFQTGKPDELSPATETARDSGPQADAARIGATPVDTPPVETAPAKEKAPEVTQSRDHTQAARTAGDDAGQDQKAATRIEKAGRSEDASKAKLKSNPKAEKSDKESASSPANLTVSEGALRGVGEAELSTGKAKASAARTSDNHSRLADERASEGKTVHIDVILDGASSRTEMNDIADGNRARTSAKDDKNAKMLRAENATRREESEERTEERVPVGQRARIRVDDLRGRTAGDGASPDRSDDSAKKGQSSFAEQLRGSQIATGSDDSSSGLAFFRGGADATSMSRGALAQGKASAGMMNALRQTLSGSVNADVVRAARLVVRGSDTGEIRLNLKPETLGNVRIMLEMKDGHIAGRIIVENSSVREVFEQNMASLIKAFNESGLETGGLDVTVADSGNQNQEQSEGRGSRQAIRELDRAVPLVQMLEDDHELVDLVV